MVPYQHDDGSFDGTADHCDDVADGANTPSDDGATQALVEHAILTTITIDQALDRLSPRDRALVELLYAYRAAPGYNGAWPPAAQDVCRYMAEHFTNGRPVAVRTLWAWHDAVLAQWSRQRRLAESHQRATTRQPSPLTHQPSRPTSPPAPDIAPSASGTFFPLRRAA